MLRQAPDSRLVTAAAALITRSSHARTVGFTAVPRIVGRMSSLKRVTVLSLIVAACGSVRPPDDDAGMPDAAITINIVAGDHGSGVAGSALATPLTVAVETADHLPLENFGVTFAVTEGGGTLSATSARTDVLGRAEVGLTLGTVTGVDNAVVTASAPGATGVSFTLSTTADLPAVVTPGAAAVPEGVVATMLPQPLVATVTDRFGNAVGNAPISFAVTAGGGELSVTSTQTDAEGEARSLLTLGTVAGIDTVEARVGTLAPARFTAQATPDLPAQLAATGGGSAVAGTTLPQPLIVNVHDRFGNPTPGATVGFVVTAGGGAASTVNTVADAQGQAQSTWTLGAQVGANTLEVRSPGLASVALSATGTVGSEAQVAVSSGNGQSAAVATNLAAPLTVTVKDANSNPRPNTTVSFVVTSNNGAPTSATAVTNAVGVAQTTFKVGTAAGPNLVEARVSGLSPAVFAATGFAGAPTQLTGSGSGQTGVAGDPLGAPFIATVRDQFGNPTPNVQVGFVVTGGGGAMSAPSETTNLQGQVQSVLTLGATVGTNTVEARVPSVTSAAFIAQGGPGPATQLAIVSGDGQTACVESTSSSPSPTDLPLTVRVADRNNNPIPNQNVVFSVATGAGSLTCIEPTADFGPSPLCAATLTRSADAQGKIGAFVYAPASTTTVRVSPSGNPNIAVTFTVFGEICK
jgi:hypothetical protein